MDLVNPDIDRYLHELSDPRDVVLREMEMLAVERSFPIVGPQVGRLLHVLAVATGARRVIELGSGFGYSAYWFARAVGPEGRVLLTEGSAERADEAREFLRRGGLAERTTIEVGDAFEIADRTPGEFDIVFNDVDKEQYPQVLPRASALLRSGGLLICDNMLWFGTVLEERPGQASTVGVKRLTAMLAESEEFETAIVPVRDGVSISVRR